jgi:RHH-type proline utilization regulon transcriptional repressor/proline dehydrogenase/delta 1-pyrroline-5-carboxylate dehydrogenase
LLHGAGVPREALALAVGPGESVGRRLVEHPKIAGVAFTGSTETAWRINRALAAKDGPIVPLIAETGGINAMLVDSSALAEQVVADVVVSAFQSAGQRCSALRALYLQEEIADRTLAMLAGAMAELRLGDPADPATDIGPVIDEDAAKALRAAIAESRKAGRVVAETPLPAGPFASPGRFVAPIAIEVARRDAPKREIFGPVLHVMRYPKREFDAVLDEIAATNFGLTLGVHSRIDATVRRVAARGIAGNLYVNRSMIGAVVGVQPFGGHGLSGTGPKAGGPHYLARFAREIVRSTNTAAVGGNVQLLAAKD